MNIKAFPFSLVLCVLASVSSTQAQPSWFSSEKLPPGTPLEALGAPDTKLEFPGTAEGDGNFTVSPTDLSFPGTHIGEEFSIQVVITNVSESTQSPNFSGGAPLDPTHFNAFQNCGGQTLAPGESCAFTYIFEPTAEGALSTTTSIGIDGENFSITMSGTGLFPFSVAPTDLIFPDTMVGDSSVIAVAITNLSGTMQNPNFTGGAPLDPAHFNAFQNCAGQTLAPGENCAFTYIFEPTAEGALSTTTSIGIDGKIFPISLSGTGLGIFSDRFEQ